MFFDGMKLQKKGGDSTPKDLKRTLQLSKREEMYSDGKEWSI